MVRKKSSAPRTNMFKQLFNLRDVKKPFYQTADIQASYFGTAVELTPV